MDVLEPVPKKRSATGGGGGSGAEGGEGEGGGDGDAEGGGVGSAEGGGDGGGPAGGGPAGGGDGDGDGDGDGVGDGEGEFSGTEANPETEATSSTKTESERSRTITLFGPTKTQRVPSFFANIFENIDGPAHFRILEYSREYRCPGRLFLKNIDLSFRPLTVVDLDSQDILKYSRRYHRGVYILLTRASRNSSFAPQQQVLGRCRLKSLSFGRSRAVFRT